MAIVRGKQKNASECMRRRFRSDVNKLKKACDELNIVILSQKECDYKDYVCILSIDEYNIFDTYKNCNKTVESYFVAPEDYEVLVEENYVLGTATPTHHTVTSFQVDETIQRINIMC